MKKIYFFMLLLFTVSMSQAQIVNIPDTNFKVKLLNHDPVIDTNGDNEIQISEAENFNGNLNLDNIYDTVDEMKITDMSGIEAFINIQGLSFNYNLVTSIDISKNTLLTTFNSYNNLLNSLDVSYNINLIYLNIQDNNLTTLDISNNNLLSLLSCGQNNLTNLDVSQNTALSVLYFNHNEITTLDVSQNIMLETLVCNNNQLSNLNVSNLISLTTLDCGNNLLNTIDISSNTLLNNLGCIENELTNLFLDNNTNLTRLNCGYNPFNNLDLTKLTNLEHLVCDRTSLTNIDLSKNTALNYLFLYDVPLNSIDLSKNTLLETVILGDNPLKNIDLSSNTILTRAICTNSYLLESVNLKNTSNTLVSMNFKNCPNLRTICVDDADDSFLNHHTTVDPHATFVENCNTDLAYNTIEGNVTFDENNNGCNISDIKIPNILVNATDGTNQFATLTDTNGNYSLSVVKNTYDTALLQFSTQNYVTITPATNTTVFSGYDMNASVDFCSSYSQNIKDVNVILIPISELQPSSDAKYQIVYENLGSNSSDGIITLQFEENLTNFDNATPTYNNITLNTLTFNYSNLEPFEKRFIDITFNTMSSPLVNQDETLNFQTTITSNSGDDQPDDNTYIFKQPVVNAYIGNEKQVLQGAEITIDEIDNYLDYIIRFQNIGTDNATNIAITDILNSNLDWNTIKIISSSHNFTTKITNSNFVEFIFDNINLPAKQDDELGSRGFIAFRVKPKNNLIVGDILSGKTEIFYDYEGTLTGKNIYSKTNYTFNESLVVNTAPVKIVAGTLSNTNNDLEKSFLLYPNPTRDEFNIIIPKSIIINKLALYSITGEQLFETNKNLKKYSLSNYKSGVYFVKVETNNGILHKKIVKK